MLKIVQLWFWLTHVILFHSSYLPSSQLKCLTLSILSPVLQSHSSSTVFFYYIFYLGFRISCSHIASSWTFHVGNCEGEERRREGGERGREKREGEDEIGLQMGIDIKYLRHSRNRVGESRRVSGWGGTLWMLFYHWIYRNCVNSQKSYRKPVHSCSMNVTPFPS